jgi:predicted phage terminase large subunit-like protein
MPTFLRNTNKFKELSRLRRERAEKSLETFGQIYLSHHVLGYKPSLAHKEIYRALQDITNKRGQKLAVAGPRGFGKSTLISLIYIIYCVCYAREKYIVIISETADAAMKILENVKKELMENEKIKTDFPEVFESGTPPKAPRWTMREIETRNQIRVAALGVQQQIRGIKYKATRPTLVLLDDIESSRTTANAEIREKLRDWLRKSVLNVGTEQTNFLFLGNLYHVACLLKEYLAPDKNPTWIKKIYRAIIQEAEDAKSWETWKQVYNSRTDFNGQTGPEAARQFFRENQATMLMGTKVIWPERWDYYTLMIKREEDPVAFRSEYQNDPLDPGTLMFDPEQFHYWDQKHSTVEELLKELGNGVTFYGACDPSLGNNSTRGDYSAIIILAWHQTTKALYVIVADIQRRQPDQLVRDIIGYHKRFQCVRFGIEANANQSLFIPRIEDAAKENQLFIKIEPITNSKQKASRIHELQPLTKNGTIQFCKAHKTLLEQLIDFPQGRHDDGPDALQMAVALSERLNRRYISKEAFDAWVKAK